MQNNQKGNCAYEKNKISVASGIRIGTQAMTTRGFKENEFEKIANIMVQCLCNKNNLRLLEELKREVLDLTQQFPIYKEDIWK